MYEIPQSILIDGKEFRIRNNGDYRMVLDCLVALEDVELTKRERILSALIIFYDDLNSLEDINLLPDTDTAIMEMFKFINCGQIESPGATVNYRLIDWEKDSQLVSSAINKVSNIEVRAVSYLHWWTFMGYFLAVGESALATVINIRSKIAKGVKLEKYETEFKRSNPNYFNWDFHTIEQKEAEQLISELWNSGK